MGLGEVNDESDIYRFVVVYRRFIEDKVEFNSLIRRKAEQIRNVTKAQQQRRHEQRDDFALTNDEWDKTLGHFEHKCAYCGNDVKLTYDHFHPFSKGGDFMKGNVIPACKSCNSSKSNKLFEEWYPKQPFYSKVRHRKILNYISTNKQLALF